MTFEHKPPSPFNWQALQAQLRASPWLEPTDDTSSQRGLIATAQAIIDRMSNSEHMREVSWQPARLANRLPRPVASLPSGEPPALGSGTTRVERPLPAPRGPLPGGAAVAVPRERLEISF